MGAAVVLASAGAGALAAQAAAATLAVTPACVVDTPGAGTSMMVVTGSGFTPGDSIEVQTSGDSAFGSGAADASGNIAITVSAPILSTAGPAAASFTLTASDPTTPLAAPVMTTFFVSNLAVATRPAEAKPSRRVTWSFSGFTPGQEVYAHYLHANKLVTTRAFGRAGGACGTLKTKAVLYPGKARYDVYTVQVDNSRRYSRHSLPRWTGTLHTHIPL